MTTGELYIATGMCLDQPGEEQDYFQVSGLSSSQRFQAIYWKCAIVFFASSRRNNPQAKHLLFTNAEKIPKIGQLDTEAFLAQMGVQVVKIPFTFCPPLDYHLNYRTTFFKFDILKYFSQHLQPEDQYSAFDSDCIWIRSADRMIQSIQEFGIINYHLDFHRISEIYTFNHSTKAEMETIYAAMGLPLQGRIPMHFGAELMSGNGQALRHFFGELLEVWETSLEFHRLNQPKLNYEEYMLSFVYNKLGVTPGTANPWLKRIWTSKMFRNSDITDFQRDVWHLPAEKIHGFKHLFQSVVDPNSKFWQVDLGDEFAQYIGQYMGVPQPVLAKRTTDFLDRRRGWLAATASVGLILGRRGKRA
ncbi:MAG: hypothetical protein HC805_01580 [Alkalinema sp. RL_2_19]|nr:hypothetical protein [Alkalinema sp. RL_2_19]